MFKYSIELSDGRFLQAEANNNHLESISQYDELHKGLEEGVHFALKIIKDGKEQVFPHHYQNRIGGFALYPMPGCCGMVVSTATFLFPDFRGTEISVKFRELKNNLAKHLGYSCMIATGITDDVLSHKNLLKSNYEIVKNFTNSRTDNKLDIAVKVL